MAKTRVPSKKKTKSSKHKDVRKELWFSKGSHVAVRADDAAKFYLCRLQQNVYNSVKEAKVRWLSTAGAHAVPNMYRISYADKIHPASILMQVELCQKSKFRYVLSGDQLQEIEKMIRLVEDVQSGDLSVQDIGDDVAEVEHIEEPPPKKRKRSKIASQHIQEKVEQHVGSKQKRKLPKKDDDLKLHPRPEIKVLKKDPLFESRLPMPYVSKVGNSKLVFRAINLGDGKMLKELLNDGSKIKSLYVKSPDHPISPLEAVERKTNNDIMAVLFDEYVMNKFKTRMQDNQDDMQYLKRLKSSSNNEKCPGTSSLQDIGKVRKVRKEGNEAFTKEDGYKWIFLKDKVDPRIFEQFESYVKKGESPKLRYFSKHIIPLLLRGHEKKAGLIMKNLQDSTTGPNILMTNILTNNTDALTSCSLAAVQHRTEDLIDITAMHCAAVNPNIKYLNKLLSVDTKVQVKDRRGQTPIHYAAGCSSPANIELLLNRGASVTDTCTMLKTPLHYAVFAKKIDNVKMLLKQAKGKMTDTDSKKYGPGGIDRPMKYGLTPLHIAAESEQPDIARVLISHGASVNAKSSNTYFKRTPLHMAAQTGNLEMVKLLVDNGAVVEQKDCYDRTALIVACKNGATKVLSYLVHIGANPERADSSGNTPLHYAAAYGWYFTLKLLLDIGVDPNGANMCKVTPLSVAFMKGHVGIVRELLNHDRVDINQALDDDSTLLHYNCEGDLTQAHLYNEIQYLVQKGAQCNIKDINGKTPLFHLVNATIGDPNKEKEGFSQSIQIAQLLLDNGCDIQTVDKNGYTAVMEIFAKCSNIALAEFLVKKGCKILVLSGDERRSTLLHELNTRCSEAHPGLPQVMETLTTTKHIKEMKKMAKCYNKEGFTPLLDVCSKISSEKEEFYNNEKDLDYIHFLVKTLHSDINAVAKEKIFPPNSVMFAEELNYAAKSTPLIMLLKSHYYGQQKDILFKIICYLVESGADLNAMDCFGMTPLYICIKHRRPRLISYLGKLKGCDTGGEVYLEDYPSLSRGHLIPALIDIGLNVRVRQIKEEPTTFLHKIFQNEEVEKKVQFEIVESLERSKHDIDFNGGDWQGRNLLHCVTRSSIEKELYDLRFSDRKMEFLECYEKLCFKLIQLGCELRSQDKWGRTPLHYILKQTTKERCKQNLVKDFCEKMTEKEINARDCEGKTALHLAAECGEIHHCLLMKADNSLYDSDGNTALALAVLNGNDECAATYMEYGGACKSHNVLNDPVIKLSEGEKQHRKMKRELAVGEDKMEIDEEGDSPTPWILEAAKNLPRIENIQEIPLFQAVLENGLQLTAGQLCKIYNTRGSLTPYDVVKMALKAHVLVGMTELIGKLSKDDFLKVDEAGRNLLHLFFMSCREKNKTSNYDCLKIVISLQSQGVPDLQVDHLGFHPIHYAVMNRRFDLAHDSLAHHTSYDEFSTGRDIRYLEAALWRIYTKEFDDSTWKYLKELFNKEMNIDQHIYLPLKSDMVKYCQPKHRKDPEVLERKSACPTTALIATIRCTSFNSKRASQLLSCNANPNVPDGNKVTPLMHAVMQNDENFVKLLLNHDYPDITDDPPPADATQRRTLNTSSLDSDSECESDSSDEDKEEKSKISEKFKPVKKTSKVDLDAIDKNGRTALHYVASPSSEGTFDNAEIAFLLVKAGAKELKDQSGLSPYSLAIKIGALQVADMLKSLGHGKKEKCHPHYDRDFTVNDGINFKDRNKPDFRKDAEKFFQDSDIGMEVDQKYVHQIDTECSVHDGVLMKDETLDVWYDVLLMKVNANRSKDEAIYRYSFYKMQLVHQPRPNLYFLFAGDASRYYSRDYHHIPISDQTQAVDEFCKIFKKMTGNEWANVNNFKVKPNKYRLLDDSARQGLPEMEAVEINLDSNMTSILPVHLLSVVRKMMNTKALGESMKKIQHLNIKCLPFGRLTKERLMQGKQLLEEIRKCVLQVSYYWTLDGQREDDKRINIYINCEMIAKLSIEYFHVIPIQHRPHRYLYPICTLPELESHIQAVDNLLEYEVACKMLLGAMSCKEKMHPADYVYKCLDCQLERMQQGDPMAQLILKHIYYLCTYDKERELEQKITGIYKVSRQGEDERLKNKGLENRRFLWHGISTSNLLSVLGHGLKSHLEMGRNRYGHEVYRNGIFLTDNFDAAKLSSDGFVLLCEVALGEANYVESFAEINFEDKTTNFNSFIHLDTLSEKKADWYKLPSGVSLYLGVGKESHYRHMRYVIQDPAQMCIRYLVQFEKNKKKEC